jgi:hypothetical protein
VPDLRRAQRRPGGLAGDVEETNPDPSAEEIIRNYPIRQPALWVE